MLRAVEAGRSVAVIAAGERWSFDDSLRPALEDQFGAGAVLSALVAHGVWTAMASAGTSASPLRTMPPPSCRSSSTVPSCLRTDASVRTPSALRTVSREGVGVQIPIP
ncbi:hypothetical protein EFY87_08015 [Flexivirga caeni]|uniref:Uncharacterized protein n=1 Tax=Flexivirga caeni TaxID=2294115 RepID=A0A3M9MB20_9MICO|nr:hypothetical protein EFY87_08015 [Flexivirga caeni]